MEDYVMCVYVCERERERERGRYTYEQEDKMGDD